MDKYAVWQTWGLHSRSNRMSYVSGKCLAQKEHRMLMKKKMLGSIPLASYNNAQVLDYGASFVYRSV